MFGPTRELIGRVDSIAYGAITRYGAAFQTASATNDLCNSPVLHRTSPTTPAGFNSSRFRLMPVRSPLLRQSRLISLPPGTEMFQFSGFAIPDLCIQSGSIRESQDQSPFGGSPELIAVFHALHRLLVPRHPPCALSSLTTMILSSRTELKESWATIRSNKQLACCHCVTTSTIACRYGKDPLALSKSSVEKSQDTRRIQIKPCGAILPIEVLAYHSYHLPNCQRAISGFRRDLIGGI